jgi:ribosomal protein L16 Arg81 hydroxylase
MDLKQSPPIERGLLSGPLIERDEPFAWHKLNRAPFTFRHRLADLPLFETSRLARLATLAAERERGSSVGSSASADRILQLSETSDWVKISYANVLDPDFALLHRTLLAEFEELTGIPIRESMNWSGMTVFMNSPHLAVPYHFDHETNFLMQIKGKKEVYLFDQTDRAVLTEREIEDFYRGNPMAGKSKEDRGHLGSRFILNPGDAVHHPPLAPHRILNLDDISVSLSIFFTFPEADLRAHVYQVNSFLRQARMRPQPPGASAESDRKKVRLMRLISKRRPKTQNEMLFSGVRRLTLPVRAFRKATKLVLRRKS